MSDAPSNSGKNLAPRPVPGPAAPASSVGETTGLGTLGPAATPDLGASSTDDLLRELAQIDEAPARAASLVGTRLGRFRVAALLGRGGMGVVYRAVDEALRREVALKVLPPGFAHDEERRRRFLREARSAAAVNHPSIATVYEVGEAEGRIYIAMELLGGRSLAAALAEGRLPVPEALRIARSILDGLGKAHEAGLVHRDLKPDNVMLTGDGAVKVLDFGLAKPLEQTSSESELGRADTVSRATTEGRVMGTPSYMSPEQVRGEAVDQRSDVFSFGVMLHEMLAGQRPFVGKTAADVMTAILRDEPEAVSKLSPAVSAELASIVARCLAKEREGRYEDCRRLLADLERVAPVAAESSRPRLRRLGTASRIALAATAAVVGALLVARERAPQPTAPVPSASSVPAPAPMPTAVTDLPVPTSTNLEAIAAYRRGLGKLRSGEGIAEMDFRRAIALDPALGAAYVQVLAEGDSRSGFDAERREIVRKAYELAATLSERNRALLSALDPVVRGQPADHPESLRRLSAMLERWPGDAQLWRQRSEAHRNAHGAEAAERDARRAVEIDPGYAMAYDALAKALMDVERQDEARRTADHCLTAAPMATNCLNLRADLNISAGECRTAEEDLRRSIAVDPERTGAYDRLAHVLAAQKQPLSMAREAFSQWEKAADALFPESYKQPYFLPVSHFGIRCAVDRFEGDFVSAERNARGQVRVIESSPLQVDHGWTASVLADILLESGQTREAGEVALGYLTRRGGWEPDRSGVDPTLPGLLRIAIAAGALPRSEATAQRGAWLERALPREASPTPSGRGMQWLTTYAAVAFSEDEAREALRALPSYEPLPIYVGDNMFALAAAGHTFLLGGRTDEAILWLERAVRHCLVLGLTHVRAHLWLGEAREHKGDREGACAAYGSVLARWGNARPRSITAEKARARARALGCPR